MSTDLQKYSTENQLETIRRYAEQRGYTIVHVFEDSGRSGLRMDGRDGLQSLMLKVQSGTADFQAILVYDVSRWGRFQDADEGAYHEHLCSRAGIPVHYCGEQFNNDGSIGSVGLLKDKMCPLAVFDVLRKMNPLRQIEAAELLINANNFSISYASAILAGTPQAQLVTPQTPKRLKGMTAEAIARMERELSRLQEAVSSIQDSYGQDHLHLTFVKGYLRS